MGDPSHHLHMCRSTLSSQVCVASQTGCPIPQKVACNDSHHCTAHEIENIEFFPYQHVQQVRAHHQSYLPIMTWA